MAGECGQPVRSQLALTAQGQDRSLSCGIELTVRNNQIVRVQGDERHPANFGKLCVKGATLDRVLATPNRLTRAVLIATKIIDAAATQNHCGTAGNQNAK